MVFLPSWKLLHYTHLFISLECQRRKVKVSSVKRMGGVWSRLAYSLLFSVLGISQVLASNVVCQLLGANIGWDHAEEREGSTQRQQENRKSFPVVQPIIAENNPFSYSPARSKGCSINDQYSPSRTNGGMTEARVSESPNLPLDIEARLSTIEMMLAHQVMPLNHTADEASPSSGSDWISSCTGHIGPSKLLPNGTDESSESFRGGTSSRSMIAALDQLVGQDQQSLGHSAPTYRHLIDSNSFQDCCGTDLLVWACRMMARDFAQIKKALVRYFTYLNPHCKTPLHLAGLFGWLLVQIPAWTRLGFSWTLRSLVQVISSHMGVLSQYSLLP